LLLVLDVSFSHSAQRHRRTDDNTMPIADYALCSTIGLNCFAVYHRPVSYNQKAGLRHCDTGRRFITSLVTAAVSNEHRCSAYFFPHQSSSTPLRSCVSWTGWRLQSGLHSNMQSLCTSVFTGLHLHTLLTSFVRWQIEAG